MAYTYDPMFAKDPNNPNVVASNATITIYDPADPTKTPIAITDTTGSPLPNPITVDGLGMGPAFQHPTLDRVAWTGGGRTNYFTSYEGMKNEAQAAKEAAQDAANSATTAAAEVVTTATVDGSGNLVLTKASGGTVNAGSVKGPKGDKGDKGNDGSNVLPTDTAIRDAINTPGSATATALSATYVPKWKTTTAYLAGDKVLSPNGDVVSSNADHTSGTTFNPANWSLSANVAGKLENARDASDTFQSLTRRITVPDIAGSKGSVLNIDHRGDGTGNTANPGQTYGIDLHNYPGAVSAMVGHQYSNNGPFLWLDNTDNQPLIRLHNTQNTTLNPGRDGTGDFFQIQDHGTEIMRITKDLVFSTLNGSKTMTILNTVAKAFSVQQASSYAGSGHAMEVIKLATGTGSALDVTNAGTGKGVYIRQNGAATGLQIDAAAAAAGLYPMVVSGQDYGPSITTATDGGVSLNVSKNGTGAGDVVKITNKGTGNALSVHNSAGTRIARIGKNGSIVTANGTAPVLADLADGETALWRDATTGDLKVTSRVSGALKTATLAVA